MPRYLCDYCDAYLTHDSAKGRHQHCRGWKHRENFKQYYMTYYNQWLAENQAAMFQQMMQQQQANMAAAMASQGGAPNFMHPHQFPPPLGASGGLLPPPPGSFMPPPGSQMGVPPSMPMFRPPPQFLPPPTASAPPQVQPQIDSFSNQPHFPFNQAAHQNQDAVSASYAIDSSHSVE